MSIKRSFVMDGKWITIEPIADPETGNQLFMNVWSMDAATQEPVELILSIPFSRSQLFDMACGLLCITLDAEPEGVFDTSHSLETNVRTLGYSENIADLMAITGMEDPAAAVTKTVEMFRRLDSRLPVLQSCQRALELCESEFDVNTLSAIANRMERNLRIDSLVHEISQSAELCEKTSVAMVEGSAAFIDGEYFGLSVVPRPVATACLLGNENEDRLSVVRWLRPDAGSSTELCGILASLNLNVAEYGNGTFQIRSDLVTPDREVTICKYSPRASIKDLELFCALAKPSFNKLYEDFVEDIAAGEIPPPSQAMMFLMGKMSSSGVVH